jgi:hypothetical protein
VVPRGGGEILRSGEGGERAPDAAGDELRGVEGVAEPLAGGVVSGPRWPGGARSAAEHSSGVGEAERFAEQPREGVPWSAVGAGVLSARASRR